MENTKSTALVPADHAQARRAQQAQEQWVIIDQMCEDLRISPSALARAAGVHDSTVTRYRRRGRPNKWETVVKMIDYYIEKMREIGRQPAEFVVQSLRGKSGIGNQEVAYEFNKDWLRVALLDANEHLLFKLKSEEIEDICAYVSGLYPIIGDFVRQTGKLPESPAELALLRRELLRRASGRGSETP